MSEIRYNCERSRSTDNKKKTFAGIKQNDRAKANQQAKKSRLIINEEKEEDMEI
jgi:hypothetical protein